MNAPVKDRSAIGAAAPLGRRGDPTLLPEIEVNAEARDLHLAAAILALSTLADSGVEHYRGQFHNRAMYLPLATGTLCLAASLFGLGDRRRSRHPVRDASYAAAAAVGLAGLGFHAYNVNKRPGGVSWLNLFYAAPIGAPFALTLAGFLGRFAEKTRELDVEEKHEAGRGLAAIVSAGLAGTIGEAALLHFRGAYHDPVMALPVTLPPLSAALLVRAALKPKQPKARGLARAWLRVTAALGFLGVGFHAFGIARNMGGWRNWRQNILNGPPLPAPPSFTGLALAGLAALKLMEGKR